MHRPALVLLMLALLSACASAPPAEPAPTPAARATLQILGHHCDGGQGVDGLAVHVETPGLAVIHWSNEGVCGRPS